MRLDRSASAETGKLAPVRIALIAAVPIAVALSSSSACAGGGERGARSTASPPDSEVGSPPSAPRAPDADSAPRRIEIEPIASGEIRGEVREGANAGGKELDGGVVLLRGGESVPELEAEIDGGEFFFGPLPPGQYELVVRPSREGIRAREVVVGENEVSEVIVEPVSRAKPR